MVEENCQSEDQTNTEEFKIDIHDDYKEEYGHIKCEIDEMPVEYPEESIEENKESIQEIIKSNELQENIAIKTEVFNDEYDRESTRELAGLWQDQFVIADTKY